MSVDNDVLLVKHRKCIKASVYTAGSSAVIKSEAIPGIRAYG